MRYARCDSCKGIFPEEMMKKVQFSYSVFNSASKDRLVTTDAYGMVCTNCGQQKPTTTKTASDEKPTTTSQKTTSTKTTSSSGRKT